MAVESIKRNRKPAFPKRLMVTAILVDGGFYRKRARALFGEKTPECRAKELAEYCRRHIRTQGSNLYRIFYYDCPPSEKVVYHPLRKKSVNLGKSDLFAWMNDFHRALLKTRSVAIRWGEELESESQYVLDRGALTKLLASKTQIEDLTDQDFSLAITQKGVDMRLGFDVASLASQGIVNQIIMISGDSDFVPAAKHARRSGIDFILDPMWAKVLPSLNEHVDGVQECVRRPPANLNDALHISNTEPADDSEDESEFEASSEL